MSDVSDLVSGIDSVIENLRNCVSAMLANEEIAEEVIKKAVDLGVPTSGLKKAEWDTKFFRGLIEGCIETGLGLAQSWEKVGGTK